MYRHHDHGHISSALLTKCKSQELVHRDCDKFDENLKVPAWLDFSFYGIFQQFTKYGVFFPLKFEGFSNLKVL